MDDSRNEPGLAFIARLLVGLAVGGVAAFRVYACVNLIEHGTCGPRDWFAGIVSLVVLLAAVKFLANTLAE